MLVVDAHFLHCCCSSSGYCRGLNNYRHFFFFLGGGVLNIVFVYNVPQSPTLIIKAPSITAAAAAAAARLITLHSYRS